MAPGSHSLYLVGLGCGNRYSQSGIKGSEQKWGSRNKAENKVFHDEFMYSFNSHISQHDGHEDTWRRGWPGPWHPRAPTVPKACR